MSFLTDNVISEAYTSLVFKKADNKLYVDNGTTDVEVLDLTGLSGTDPDNDGRFEFNSADSVSGTLASGNLAEFKNNGTEKFSLDYNGVLKLAVQSSVPSNVVGGLYTDGTHLWYGDDQ